MDHPPFPAAEWKVDTQRPRGAVCRNVPVNTRRGAGAEMLFLGQVGGSMGGMEPSGVDPSVGAHPGPTGGWSCSRGLEESRSWAARLCWAESD